MQFKKGLWNETIDVRDFIYCNIKPYNGDYLFLKQASEKTSLLWNECKELIKQEIANNGVLDIDTEKISQINSHYPGYINKDLEIIYGLQTDAPLKRAVKPFGGIRIVKNACIQNGKRLSNDILEIFTNFRKTHNDAVFDVYTKNMRLLRKNGVITGLPDNYSRGRIIGDYRRVALYGVDRIIDQKKKDLNNYENDTFDETIRLREEISEQIHALELMKDMAANYGFDISRPALNAREAIQWTYFAYLAAVKEQDGAAMSLGSVSTFFDIFIEQDIEKGFLDEESAQELIDQFVIKLRLVRHLRMNEYNDLFAGDPTWVTEAIGGILENGQHKITKTSFRFLQTLYNLGPSPEPNLTVLWNNKLPKPFKKFCAKVSIDTSSIQYENDGLMRSLWGYDDYGIACCVSYSKLGKSMQFFGARCNLAKTLLLALNMGKDEITGQTIVHDIDELKKPDDYLNYKEVVSNFKKAMKFLIKEYVSTMNTIHYMHDKYYYERAQMALIDTDVERIMAFGIAGLSVVADSLSAIKYAKVKPIRNCYGITQDFVIEGDYPKFGNDDDKVDNIAKKLIIDFNAELKKHYIYRNAKPTLSILTITSNVIYGKKTGSTPDGRLKGEPFAPGANPMHGRDTSGGIASLNSVAKLPYKHALDGISNTFTVVPTTLGVNEKERVSNLINLLDGYFENNGHHLNVNVLNKDTLIDAMNHPENYPQLTIRISGYAVNFVRLTKEQQQEVIKRTFH